MRTDWRRLVAGELGLGGVLTLVGVVALVLAVPLLFSALRPPTVEQVEFDIWRDWAQFTPVDQSETLVGTVLAGRSRQAAAQTFLETFGKASVQGDSQQVVRRNVRSLRLVTAEGETFASWRSDSAGGLGSRWRQIAIPLTDPALGRVATLHVDYTFYSAGLDYLPSIRKLQRLYPAALATLGLLTLLVVVAVAANVLRIRERVRRLRSQQVTIDLARQMCHELRNGLWAFSLEGKNLRQLFDVFDEFLQVHPQALEHAAGRLKLTDGQRARLLRSYSRAMAERQVDAELDVAPVCAMARDAHAQIENFSRYINLTVEELDRYLLGGDGTWEPVRLRLCEAWREARLLLALRVRSAGVKVVEDIPEDADDHVHADRRALVHVFVNLLKNAVEAVRDGHGDRTVTFTLTPGDPQRCEIHNGGVPIPPDLLPHLFERGVSTKSGAGRGTGLALIRRSVQRCGGDVAVRSDDAGTTFRLTFPADRTAAE